MRSSSVHNSDTLAARSLAPASPPTPPPTPLPLSLLPSPTPCAETPKIFTDPRLIVRGPLTSAVGREAATSSSTPAAPVFAPYPPSPMPLSALPAAATTNLPGCNLLSGRSARCCCQPRSSRFNSTRSRCASASRLAAWPTSTGANPLPSSAASVCVKSVRNRKSATHPKSPSASAAPGELHASSINNRTSFSRAASTLCHARAKCLASLASLCCASDRSCVARSRAAATCRCKSVEPPANDRANPNRFVNPWPSVFAERADLRWSARIASSL
mmetsp:Transcript_12262/g.28641  ORF Transcript_12262/g.28641 Transcript_12262/m.28641 type:complete len:273 (+) Transcript_12262:346-1164(+)